MKRTIEKIINYIKYVAEPEEIVLFGSVAKGNDNVFSDLDLLIVSESCAKKYINEKVISFSKELSVKIDLLIYSQREIEVELINPISFISAIVKCGKIIYKKEYYLTSSLLFIMFK